MSLRSSAPAEAGRYTIDMTRGPLMRQLVCFAFPLMISGILQLLFNAADLVVVGRFSGSLALAAVGATTTLLNLFINLFIGISTGANVIAARYIAVNDEENVQEAVHTAITTAIVSGIMMMCVGLVFARGALRLMNTPDNIINDSVLYMRIYFCGTPFFMLYNYGAAILRAAGDTRRPLQYLLTAGVCNACLNLILVIVFHLSVAGVAIATVTSQFISCALVLRCLVTEDAIFRLDFKKLHINPDILWKILRIGVPAGLQFTVINFSNAMLQSAVNTFGADAVAGHTAANSMNSFLYASVNSITQACMSFTSQNYSVRNFRRMDQIVLDCVLLEVIVGGTLGGLYSVFGAKLLRIYSTEPAVIDYGLCLISATALPYFLAGIMDCLPGALRGMGYSLTPMLLSVTGTVGTRIVWLSLVFPHYRTVFMVFAVYPVSWIITVAMQATCFFIIRRRVRKKG